MRVSVIIPTYNCAKWLKESIASVLDQEMTDLELIIVDDGSTDDTAEMVRAVQDARVRYFPMEHTGLSRARNEGLRRARGEYVAWLDADDLWPKDYLNVMVSSLERAPEYGAAYCTPIQIHPNGVRIEHFRGESCVSGQITRAYFLRRFVWIPGTVLRRACAQAVPFEESLRNAMDVDMFLRLSLSTKFLFVPQVQFLRRVRSDSLSQTQTLRCTTVLVLERFYFRLGGQPYVPEKEAKALLSRSFVRIARHHRSCGARKAAIELFRRALRYDRFSRRAMTGLARSLLMRKDIMPDWEMPPPLPDEILHSPISLEGEDLPLHPGRPGRGNLRLSLH